MGYFNGEERLRWSETMVCIGAVETEVVSNTLRGVEDVISAGGRMTKEGSRVTCLYIKP